MVPREAMSIYLVPMLELQCIDATMKDVYNLVECSTSTL